MKSMHAYVYYINNDRIGYDLLVYNMARMW